MYSNFGKITPEIILSGVSPATGNVTSNVKEVNFDGVELKQERNKNLLYLANVDAPDSMKNPPLFALGLFIIDGDQVTYKLQGERLSWSNEEADKMRAQGITEYEDMRAKVQDEKAQVKGTASLQDLYNQYKDDPKFEQMKNKVK